MAYYRLNETSGTSAADTGSNATNGTYSGTYTLNQAAFVTGGKSVSFSGASASQVNCNFATNYTSACTLEFLFNPNASGSGAGGFLVGKSVFFAAVAGDFPIQVLWDAALSKVGFKLSSGNDFAYDASILSNVMATGVDYHVVAVYRANGLCELYIDGVLAASTTIGFTINTNARNWRIAAAQENAGGVGASAFAGRMGEVAIYNAALSASRVLAHYNARNL